MSITRQKPVPLSAAASGYLSAINKTGTGKTLTASEKYDAGRNIYANKVGYMNRYNKGDINGAEKFRTAAAPSYSALSGGGAGKLADTLHSSDVPTATRILSDLAFDAYSENYRDNSNKVIDNTIKKINMEYDNNKNAANSKYDDLARQGYLNYMEAKKAMPQQLKAQGMTGGLSESSQIALRNNYGQQVSENQRARLQALSELDTAKTGALLDAENKRLEVESDLAEKGYELNITNLGYDREDAQLDKQIDAQKDLQTDSQNWQSGENSLDRAHDFELLDKEQSFNADEARNAEAHELKVLAIKNNHDASESVLDRQLEAAISSAQNGDFTLLSQITGVPKEELLQNYKNILWADASYPYIAANMYPKQSTINHVSSKTGNTGNNGSDNVPEIKRPY